MFRYQIIIEYDGTDFVGWQSQINGKSIQKEIEKILSKILKEKIKVYGSGRTDSGVHATNQSAHFDIKKSIKGVQDYDMYKEDGLYDVEKIVVESSNIGTAQIALKIGKKNQKDFLKKLGFFEKLDIELLEAEEPLANPNNWGSHETTRISFGHSFSITPLHLVKAYGTISNKGYIVNT